MPREIKEAVFLVPMPDEWHKETIRKCTKAFVKASIRKGNTMSLDKDSFNKSTRILTSILRRLDSEAEAEYTTEILTQLRDYSEHRRREFVQRKLNQKYVDEANKNSQSSLNKLDFLLE